MGFSFDSVSTTNTRKKKLAPFLETWEKKNWSSKSQWVGAIQIKIEESWRGITQAPALTGVLAVSHQKKCSWNPLFRRERRENVLKACWAAKSQRPELGKKIHTQLPCAIIDPWVEKAVTCKYPYIRVNSIQQPYVSNITFDQLT